jgi:exopolyphosphatase/guanosine-5'-triphosphate,3'-diphosphate pyrophosphatase
MATSELLTLIDIGSNAVRCLLVELTPGNGFTVLRQERAQTRLGSGCVGVLPETAVNDTVEVISSFLREVRKEGPAQKPLRTVAVATAAVRDATNRNDFLRRLKREAGISVRVLSGEDEARLGALAALERLAFRDGVVVDLGGGSLQISLIRAGGVHHAASAPLGAVRTTKRFFKNDPPAKREVLALREEVQNRVRALLPAAREGKTMIGIGGTVRTLASMQIATLDGPQPSRQGFRLWRSDITRLREQLEISSTRERQRIPGLKAERADIILAGAVVVEEVMALGSYGELVVCKDGVRHGLLLHELYYGGAERGRDSVPQS